MPFRRFLPLIACALLALLPLAPQAASPRIVVLVPSFADDLDAVGAHDAVVGVSQFTTGAHYAGVPRVADFQSVDAEKIVALHPSIVFGLPSQERYVEPLRRAGIDVRLIADDSYDDLFTDIRELSAAAGRSREGLALERSLRAQTEALRRETSHFRHHPTVFLVLGTGPIWSAGPGTYIGTLIRFAGGRDGAERLGNTWGEFSEEALLALQPDAVITANDTHIDSVLHREPWKSLRAVTSGHVFILNDTNILYRPGPRYNEGLRWLIERLKPLST